MKYALHSILPPRDNKKTVKHARKYHIVKCVRDAEFQNWMVRVVRLNEWNICSLVQSSWRYPFIVFFSLSLYLLMISGALIAIKSITHTHRHIHAYTNTFVHLPDYKRYAQAHMCKNAAVKRNVRNTIKFYPAKFTCIEVCKRCRRRRHQTHSNALRVFSIFIIEINKEYNEWRKEIKSKKNEMDFCFCCKCDLENNEH